MVATCQRADSDQADHDVRSDEALLEDHLDGDGQAFGVLVARRRQRVYALGVRILHDRDEAEDATQDAFLRALRRASSYRGDADVLAWLNQIMINVCRTRLRARRSDASFDEDDEALTSLQRDLVFTDEIDSQLVTGQVLASSLPDNQRIAILLVDIMGYSIADAARLLDVAPGTVKSRCARGRLRLEALLREQRRGQSQRTVGRNPDHEAGQP